MTKHSSCKMCGKNREIATFKPIGLGVRCPHCFFVENKDNNKRFPWQDYKSGILYSILNKDVIENDNKNRTDDEIINNIRTARFVNHVFLFGYESPLAEKLLFKSKKAEKLIALSTEPFRLSSETYQEFILRILFHESISDGLTSEAIQYLKEYTKINNSDSFERESGIYALMNAMLFERYGLSDKAQSYYHDAYGTFRNLSEKRLQLCTGILSARAYYHHTLHVSNYIEPPQLIESGAAAAIPIILESLVLSKDIGTLADVSLLQTYLLKSLLTLKRDNEAQNLLKHLLSQLNICKNWEFEYTLLCLVGGLMPKGTKEGLDMLQAATEIGDKFAPMWLNSESWYKLGKLYQETNSKNVHETCFAFRTALDRWDWAISFIHLTEARTRLRSKSQKIQRYLLDVSSKITDPDTTLLAMESGKDRFLRELMSGKGTIKEVPENILEKDTELRNEIFINILNQLISTPADSFIQIIENLFAPDNKEKIYASGLQLNTTELISKVKHWQDFQSEIDEYYFIDGTKTINATIESIQKCLPPRTIFLETHNLGATSVVYLTITNDKVRLIRTDKEDVWESITKIKPNEIVRMSDNKMLCEIPPEEEDGITDEKWKEVSSKFYEMEFSQIDDLIESSEHIIFSSQGQGIPPATMCRNGQYLIKTHKISFISSASAWLNLYEESSQKQKKPLSTLSCFGNPLMGVLDNTVKPNLPGAEDEVSMIKNLNLSFQRFKCYLREEATAYLFMQELEKSDVLHLACHSYFVPYEPRLSSLLLAPCSKHPYGNVDVIDILRSNIKARLVVLSSCNSGRQSGTRFDQYGFVNAFLASGVPSVLASQWEVDDEIAALFMKTFYSKILVESPAESLRQAQIKILNNPTTSHPYYWASFILSGISV